MKLHKLLRYSLIFIVEDAHAEDLIEGLWKEEGICIRIHRCILELHDTSFKFPDDVVSSGTQASMKFSGT